MMDYSTIDLEALKRLPTFVLSPMNLLQKYPGNHCLLDAPGYPSYFTRKVCQRNGIEPLFGPELVITHGDQHYVIATADAEQVDVLKALRSLWKPLPFEHQRVQLWERDVYRHFARCYTDDTATIADDHGKTFVYPIPKYKLKSYVDDPRFDDEQRAHAQAEVETYNRELQQRTWLHATFDNHQAYRRIKMFYADAQHRADLIDSPPDETVGQWWETDAVKPTLLTCNPRSGIGGVHDGTLPWCQWCGWRA